MANVLIIDTRGDSREALSSALVSAGHRVIIDEDHILEIDSCIDAVVLATDAANFVPGLKSIESLRTEKYVPVIVVAELEVTGWGAMFSDPGALEVDALFDKPVDAHGVVQRLESLLAARQSIAIEPDMVTIDMIVERAIANEIAAEAFYRQAAERVSDLQTRDALEMLMRDEQEHKVMLEQYRSGERVLPETHAPVGKLVEVFGTPELNIDLAPADAFLLAAKKEALAVQLYENWAQLYPDGPERDLLNQLAEVERRHKTRVESIFLNASFPESW